MSQWDITPYTDGRIGNVSGEFSPIRGSILTGYHNDFLSNTSAMLKKMSVRYMSHTLVEQDQEDV